MTEVCSQCGGILRFLCAWWYCDWCGWVEVDPIKDKVRQQLANDPEAYD